MSLAKSVSGSLHVINGGFSMNQWRNFESAIDSAKKINMLSAKEARAIKLAIRMEDPMISIIFDRSNRNFNAFIESLKLKVWQILSKTGAKNIKSTFLRPSNVQIDHVSLQGNAESDPVSGSLPRPVQQQHVGIQPLRSRQLSPLPRPVSTAPVIEVSAQTLKQEGHENISQDNLPHN
ncbi:hypothetical protein BCR33DRAFT_519339 [Rhizoclosmatium globosum]|uniref:Uncharacterized protein n=1 Tax=Rhizoclosmatium globosum TaxID=329046 RepID=A0A1Y2BHH1_9FUNG|nr:hypothetical protein BCR33DRAFT_519339 [Rhizoclosmatium globosum]|eukprot:ORY33575.1 hypothetical protein BCR33DRAFT_519339 [Rhizoclosmatium globosum]